MPVITTGIACPSPIDTIGDIRTDVASWPSWQPDVGGAQANGPLAVSSVFRRQTAGLGITSTGEEIDAPHQIVWGAPPWASWPSTSGPLDAPEDGMVVSTESWEGEPVTGRVQPLARYTIPGPSADTVIRAGGRYSSPEMCLSAAGGQDLGQAPIFPGQRHFSIQTIKIGRLGLSLRS